ncbi:hypothetical protein EDC96DRAFT_71023 [Choanephora cucurbitarum]|nr:hypothetical protein EDC96DRAFT_71023 [Choanephora cucurbitarum]
MRPVVLHQSLVILIACLGTTHQSLSSSVDEPQLMLATNDNNISAQPLVFTDSLLTNESSSKKDSAKLQSLKNESILESRTMTTTSYKISVLIFEMFASLCMASPVTYNVINNVLSEVKGEQYRFERLIRCLQDLEIDKRACGNDIAQSMHLLEEQERQEKYDCAIAALSFFNSMIQAPNTAEERNSLRMELERRGFEDFTNSLYHIKESLPSRLEKQIANYIANKQMDLKKIECIESNKRQSILQLQPDDFAASALKTFHSEPDIYYLVVDSISELVKIGSDQIPLNKPFVQDIWRVIHLFIKSLASVKGNSKHIMSEIF